MRLEDGYYWFTPSDVTEIKTLVHVCRGYVQFYGTELDYLLEECKGTFEKAEVK